MRFVTLLAIVPDQAPADVYRTLANFADYPKHSDAVRSVDVSHRDGDAVVSRWEVNFRSGILRWTERDRLRPELLRIDFEQLEGDIAAFVGTWRCSLADDGTAVQFSAGVELGIPTLADVLDPIAARALLENTARILSGLFGAHVRVEVSEDNSAAATALITDLMSATALAASSGGSR